MEILNLNLHQILKVQGVWNKEFSPVHRASELSAKLTSLHFFPAMNSAKDVFLDLRCFSSFSSLFLI